MTDEKHRCDDPDCYCPVHDERTEWMKRLEESIKKVETECHGQALGLGGMNSMLRTLGVMVGGSVSFLAVALTIFWNTQNGNAERVRKLENAAAVQEALAAQSVKKLDEILLAVSRGTRNP